MNRFMLLFLVVILSLVASGCTVYRVTRADGTSLTIASTREFPNGIDVGYKSNEGAELTVNAGPVSNDSILRSALAETLLRMLQAPPAQTGGD